METEIKSVDEVDIPTSKPNTDETIVEIIINFTKLLVLITTVYFIGYIGWSVAWIYCLAIIVVISQRLTKDKKAQWNISRAMAMGYEKEIITKLQHLPSWVHFPDVERVEWLNRIIKQTWPRVNHYTRNLVPKLIEPVVQSYIKSFKFDEVVLGHVPFRIDGIKVYDEDASRNKIVMDLDISYAGDCRITFQVAGMTGGIEDFQLRGKLRVVMKPLISSIPIIGGIQAYFMDEPEIDFELVGVVQLLAMPGLRNILQKSVLEAINSMLLFPNMYPIKLSDAVETEELKVFEPEGILRVHVVEAKHLMKKDFGLMGNGKSDPYTIVTLGPQKFKTPTIDNTVDPKWDFWCEFEVDSNSELRLHVWDKDEGSKDETLGSAMISLKNIAQKGRDDLWVPLEDVMHGMIHVRVTWLSLSCVPSDIDAILKETQMLGHGLHSALLVVYVDSAKKLQRVKASSEPDTYAVIQVENTTLQTNIAPHSCNPVWEHGFTFMVLNPKTATMSLTITDKKSGNEIGELTYKVNELMDQHGLEIKRQPFILNKGGPECTVICSLKLRIFKQITSEDLPEGEQDVDDLEVFSKISQLKKQDSTFSNKSVKSELRQQASEEKNTEALNFEPSMTPRNSVASSYEIPNELPSIKLTLRYSPQRQKLIVVVHEVASIPVKNGHLPDPYVKLYLVPGKHKDTKRKTRVAKDSCNPVFDETFEYLISEIDLGKMQLEVTVATAKKVFDISNNVLGQVNVDLSKYNLAQFYNDWFELKTRKYKAKNKVILV